MPRVPRFVARLLVVTLCLSLAPGICRPQLTWFLDSATLYAPGDVVQPDLAYCGPYDPYPCPPGAPNQQVTTEFSMGYTMEDEGGWEFLRDNGSWSSGLHPTAWDETPGENEIILDNAIHAMESTAVQQMTRGGADKIGEYAASRVTTGSGTVFSGLASTASYGIRFIAARIAVS